MTHLLPNPAIFFTVPAPSLSLVHKDARKTPLSWPPLASAFHSLTSPFSQSQFLLKTLEISRTSLAIVLGGWTRQFWRKMNTWIVTFSRYADPGQDNDSHSLTIFVPAAWYLKLLWAEWEATRQDIATLTLVYLFHSIYYLYPNCTFLRLSCADTILSVFGHPYRSNTSACPFPPSPSAPCKSVGCIGHGGFCQQYHIALGMFFFDRYHAHDANINDTTRHWINIVGCGMMCRISLRWCRGSLHHIDEWYATPFFLLFLTWIPLYLLNSPF